VATNCCVPRQDTDAAADPSAAPFETAIRTWIEETGRGDRDAAGKALCTTALELLPAALSCGWVGFRILHEMIGVLSATSVGPTAVLAHEAPVYYGMLVATFATTSGVADAAVGSSNQVVAARFPVPAIARVPESFAGCVTAVTGQCMHGR